jgi:hypothetical protein
MKGYAPEKKTFIAKREASVRLLRGSSGNMRDPKC